ncbi:MAG TPA: hypothetical protein VJU16_04755, partial [Planctomycetota bacterium]|nr:hypothetical protein [Planctomycetota bacterium]
MPHRVSHRELTPEEASDLGRRSRLSGMSGCDVVMVPVGISGCITLLWILLWVPVAVVVRLLGREPSDLISSIMTFGVFIIGAVAWAVFFIGFLVTGFR